MSNQSSETNRLLGYPPDARLLIINADDFGMCHAVNAAIMRAFGAGLVSSTTLMIPCAWSLHARKLLSATPELPFGVHLTAVSEQPDYRWGPVLGRSTVPSLVDEAGYFYNESRVDEFYTRAEPDELEREFRAQIETVLEAGLEPTHLDSHCGIHSRRDWAFDLTLRLAREYGLVVRADPGPIGTTARQQGYPILDHALLDSYRLPVADKAARYVQLLRNLPPGLSEWAVHPGLGNDELKAIMPSWSVRQSDFDFFTSAEARSVVEEEGIVILDYRRLQTLWQAVQSRGT